MQVTWLISGFYVAKKQLGMFFLAPLDVMLVYHKATPIIKFGDMHILPWVERGTVRVITSIALPKNTIQCPSWPGFEPRLDLETITLIMRPLFPSGGIVSVVLQVE